ncbi:MAG: hypothetical protein GY820_34520 [Gammaproteobacteria bacterium]|nr:hypothetical protein [Gammaproteobacteria bacterium]
MPLHTGTPMKGRFGQQPPCPKVQTPLVVQQRRRCLFGPPRTWWQRLLAWLFSCWERLQCRLR